MLSIFEPTSSDVPRMRAFILRAWDEAGHAALGWTGASAETINEIASADFLNALLSRAGTRIFVAQEGQEIVGFAVLQSLSVTDAELSGLVVLEGQTGRGVGSTLLERIRASARAAGIAQVVVKTEAFNERAIRFYQHHGFAPIERRWEDVQGSRVDLVLLRLALHPEP